MSEVVLSEVSSPTFSVELVLAMIKHSRDSVFRVTCQGVSYMVWTFGRPHVKIELPPFDGPS